MERLFPWHITGSPSKRDGRRLARGIVLRHSGYMVVYTTAITAPAALIVKLVMSL